MGLFDSFHDEDAECPECHARLTEWQTKDLENLGEHWKKGDFVQYCKLKRIPEKERKRKYGNSPFPGYFRSKEYLSDAPLLFNAKIPVYTSCDKCEVWLEAYAKILDGRFASIVEAESGVEAKQRVVVKREATAQTLRTDYEKKLSQLQESCSHKKTKWVDLVWPPTLNYGRALVCLNCEKRLEMKQGGTNIRVWSSNEAVDFDSNIRKGRKGVSSSELGKQLRKGREEDKVDEKVLEREYSQEEGFPKCRRGHASRLEMR